MPFTNKLKDRAEKYQKPQDESPLQDEAPKEKNDEGFTKLEAFKVEDDIKEIKEKNEEFSKLPEI